jgi:hypothetical protein
MNREVHVRICERLGVKFPRPTRHQQAPYVDGPLLARVFLQCFDQIACVHMSGLLSRSHMNAGQDGFRDASSRHASDLYGQWGLRSISRLGSIDHTICSSPCKFWHRLSTVALKCSSCLAELYAALAGAMGGNVAV